MYNEARQECKCKLQVSKAQQWGIIRLVYHTIPEDLRKDTFLVRYFQECRPAYHLFKFNLRVAISTLYIRLTAHYQLQNQLVGIIVIFPRKLCPFRRSIVSSRNVYPVLPGLAEYSLSCSHLDIFGIYSF